MKLKNILGILLVASIAFSACDEIANPVIQKQRNSSLPNRTPDFIDSSATSGTYSYLNYKVLVEDCMGHTCSNCPPAVYAGDALISSAYPHVGRVVLMEENMGNFADTTTYSQYPDTAFRKDYTSIAGNHWLSEFSIGFFPWGMINRSGYPNNMFNNYNNWSDSVSAYITNNPTPSVTINIHDSCWTSPRIIGTQFQVTFKKALSGTYSFEAAIIEDSIIDWQLDNSTLYGADSLFVHRNVLRGSFDGTGTGNSIPATMSSVANGSWTSFQTYDFTAGENGKAAKWNMAHCYIVAFVFNATTQAVVQAEMIKVE